jgi:Tripartite tricarboxylate transporter TctB family
MKCTGRAIFCGVLVVFFAFFVWRAKDWPAVVRLFPWAIGFPMLLVSIALLVGELRAAPGRNPADQSPLGFRFTEGFDPAIVRKRTLTSFAWLFATLAAIWLFGFLIALPLIVFLYTKVQSRERWSLSLALAGVCWLMLVGLFDRVLHLPFPEGIVFGLLKEFL